MGLSSKLLKIESSELPKVLDFAFLGALLQAGISIGLASADTIFLTKIGPDKLPLIYLLTPLIFLVYIPIYSYLTSRIGINGVFKLTLSILAAGGIAIFSLLNWVPAEYQNTVIYAVKLYSILWYIALYTLFWNFADAFFDILDAKRVFSALSAGSALGAALGGATVSGLSSVCGVDELFLIWSLTAVASYPALCRCLRRWQAIDNDIIPTNQSGDILTETKSLVKTFRSSSFAMVLGGLLFLTMVVTLVCEYQFSHVLSRGRSEEELAYLFGSLFCAVHSINLFINLFVFNRLVMRFGVRNVALIQPVVYTLAFVLFIFDYSFLAGVFGFFAFHGILTSIDFNNTNLLINALPKENKRQLRTFIEGICEPMANAVAGVFLIFLVAQISPVQISTIGLIAAVACFALALILRDAYLKSMVSNLKKSWMDLSSNGQNTFAKFTESDYQALAMTINNCQSSLSDFALGIMTKADNKRSLQIFLTYLSKVNPEKQAQVSDLLDELLFSLGDKDSVKIISWLDSNIENLHPSIIEVFAEYGLISELKAERLNENLSTALIATMAVKGLSSIENLINAFSLIKNSLDGNSEEKCSSLRAIGHSSNCEYAAFVIPLLKDPQLEIRIEALKALQKLISKDSKESIPDLLFVIENGSNEEQILALECFAKIKDLKATEQLLTNAEILSPTAGRRLELIITSYGLSSIPVSVKILKDQSFNYYARSISARVLSRLSSAQLEAITFEIIFTEIAKASDYSRRCDIFTHADRTSPGQEVLRKHCFDQQSIIIEFILELLALNGRVANFELLLSSLRSKNKKERADAIETIQQACDSKTNNLILPLINSTFRSENIDSQNSDVKAYSSMSNELYEALSYSLERSGQLEAASAAEALTSLGYELDLTEKTKLLLRKKLSQYSDNFLPQQALVIDTLVSILTNSHLKNGSCSTIRKIAILQQSDFFRGFSSEELYSISLKAENLSFKENMQVLDVNKHSLYLIISGRIRELNRDVHETYSLLGERMFFGLDENSTEYISETESVILKIPSNAILEIIKSNAKAGIHMLNRKLHLSKNVQNNLFKSGVSLPDEIISAEEVRV